MLEKINELKTELNELARNRDYAPAFKSNIQKVRMLVSEIESMVEKKVGGNEQRAK